MRLQRLERGDDKRNQHLSTCAAHNKDGEHSPRDGQYTLGVVEDRVSIAFDTPENELKMCHNKEHVDCRRRVVL